MDLSAPGENAISRWGTARRKRPSLMIRSRGKPMARGLTEIADKLASEQSWETLADGFRLVAAETGAMGRLFGAQAKAAEAVDEFLRAQDEELDMLWWLTGQRSVDCDCTFDAIGSNARPLVLAKELADKTTCFPGPASVKGILSRAGLREGEKVSIAAAVNAAAAQWNRWELGATDPSPVSMPVHTAIKLRWETGSDVAWTETWAASVGVEDGYALSALTLGNLFYRERLLAGETG